MSQGQTKPSIDGHELIRQLGLRIDELKATIAEQNNLIEGLGNEVAVLRAEKDYLVQRVIQMQKGASGNDFQKQFEEQRQKALANAE